jgi:hypothetical protein
MIQFYIKQTSRNKPNKICLTINFLIFEPNYYKIVKSNMKQMMLIIFVIFCSIVTHSQTNLTLKKDSTKLFLRPLSLNSFHFLNNSSPNIFSHNYSLKNTSTLHDLQYDSKYISQVYYDNFVNSDNKKIFIYNHHFYYVKNPIQPFSSGRNTLFLGTLNYLRLLIDNQ